MDALERLLLELIDDAATHNDPVVKKLILAINMLYAKLKEAK